VPENRAPPHQTDTETGIGARSGARKHKTPDVVNQESPRLRQ
jgi:hypothetical protein